MRSTICGTKSLTRGSKSERTNEDDARECAANFVSDNGQRDEEICAASFVGGERGRIQTVRRVAQKCAVLCFFLALCVFVIGCLIGCAKKEEDNGTAVMPTFSDVSVVYDGKSHAIYATNAAFAKYSLSADGPWFDDAFEFTEEGEYRVYCYVEKYNLVLTALLRITPAVDSDDPNAADQPPFIPDEGPTEPDDPETPEEPIVPDNPEVPDEPTAPDEPEVPDEPTAPDEPEVPDEPTEPDSPDIPDESTEPDNPEVPDEPTEPEVKFENIEGTYYDGTSWYSFANDGTVVVNGIETSYTMTSETGGMFGTSAFAVGENLTVDGKTLPPIANDCTLLQIQVGNDFIAVAVSDTAELTVSANVLTVRADTEKTIALLQSSTSASLMLLSTETSYDFLGGQDGGLYLYLTSIDLADARFIASVVTLA